MKWTFVLRAMREASQTRKLFVSSFFFSILSSYFLLFSSLFQIDTALTRFATANNNNNKMSIFRSMDVGQAAAVFCLLANLSTIEHNNTTLCLFRFFSHWLMFVASHRCKCSRARVCLCECLFFPTSTDPHTATQATHTHTRNHLALTENFFVLRIVMAVCRFSFSSSFYGICECIETMYTQNRAFFFFLHTCFVTGRMKPWLAMDVCVCVCGEWLNHQREFFACVRVFTQQTCIHQSSR